MKYIIARHDEDISWSNELDRFVVQKDEHIPNVGRESSSWLWYIVNHYEELDGTYAFRQGEQDGLYHGKKWSGTVAGELSSYGYNIAPLAEHLGVELPPILEYWLGAQYDVDADVLRMRTREWYRKALDAACNWPMAPWLFERLWPYIWFGKARPWES